MASLLVFLFAATQLASAIPQNLELLSCGKAFYLASKYTCYDDFLCPVLNDIPTSRCGSDCYLPSMYSCENGHLIYPPESPTPTATAIASLSTCTEPATQFHLSDPPYEDYFCSDCHLSTQVVVTSPLDSSDLTIISPRLLIAWPAGNSGVVSFFAPQNELNGSLAISLVNRTTSREQGTLSPVYQDNVSGNPVLGVSGLIRFNSSAILSVAILGSIRTIRDFTEGPSILVPEIQNATRLSQGKSGQVSLDRLWLDNITSTTLSFVPTTDGSGSVSLSNSKIFFEAGLYNFSASYNYPQLSQLSTKKVLNPSSQDLISQFPDQTTSLSFLSYSTKLLAGAWRFLTYFGRDSMISLLLLQPVLSEGEGGAIEAVIGAVLERINKSDGSVCHEETIGDYATYLNMQDNVTSTAPQYDYKMIDSDYYLPIILKNYFVDSAIGRERTEPFLRTKATIDPKNQGLSYADLALITAEKIMNTSAAFASPGGQTKDNLIHLKDGQIVGEWRDSTYGIGGGRIPYDVNTALVPAALRAIAVLAGNGFFAEHPEWNSTAAQYAQVWEDETLNFFETTILASTAKDLVQTYISESNFSGVSNVGNITSDIIFHGLSLDGNNNQPLVRVMNTDDCFRLFLLNTTNETQLSSFLSQNADNILRPFPVGLSTNVGLLVANPAYGGNPIYAANWTNSAYHGTVVWSWPMSMMAGGLQRQLSRCTSYGTSDNIPSFCSNSTLHAKILSAYNHLWDLIEANSAQLSSEVWSWVYRDGAFQVEALGSLPPPPGSSPTESDVRQLWSLTFLAIRRDESLK